MLDTCLICKGTHTLARSFIVTLPTWACDRITAAITAEAADRAPIKVLLDPYNPVGSTSHVNFNTSKTSRWETDSRRATSTG